MSFGSRVPYASYVRDLRCPRSGGAADALDVVRCGPLVVGRLAVPVVQRLDPAEDADAAKADLVRARVVADVVRLAGAVDEARHAVRARLDEVSDARAGRTHDGVAGA